MFSFKESKISLFYIYARTDLNFKIILSVTRRLLEFDTPGIEFSAEGKIRKKLGTKFYEEYLKATDHLGNLPADQKL